MSVRQILAGSTSRSVTLYIVDSTTGAPEVGVVFNTTGMDLWYRRDLAAKTSITEVTLAALTTAYTSGGFKEIGNGWYRLDVPNAAFAAGVAGVQIGGTVTGMVVLAPYVELTTSVAQTGDSYARIGATGSGLTSLASAANLSTANAGIVTIDGIVDSILVDTGTTLDGKLNTIDTNVDAILVDTAEIGTAGAGLTNINLPNQTMDIIGNITGSLSGSVGSVTGAVGSVTGAVGSVTGSVGSVVGHTAQTGDSYARLGAPTGASVSADVASNLTAINSIASTSAAISVQAESYTLTTGTQSSGTFTNTETLDATAHEHTDSAGTMELYYQFDVGGASTAVTVDADILLNGSNDTLQVYAYNWGGTSWDQVGVLVGQASTTDYINKSFSLLTRHTGISTNLGKVRLRFQNASLSSATLKVDRISCAYSIVAQSVGYDSGAVWIDTVSGVAGTESFVNGVADNPVNTIADALTIASAVNLRKFEVGNGSSISLVATASNKVFEGHEWALALGSQNVASSMFIDAEVSGTGTGSASEYQDCIFGITSLVPMQAYNCSFTATTSGGFTMSAAGDYRFINCQSGVAGASSPLFTLGTASITAEWRRWSGGITISAISADDTLTVGGELGTVTLNGADGTVEIRGTYKAIVDNRTGSPTLSIDGAIKGSDVAAIVADTNELQTDWADGGRLDLILDSASAPTAAAVADAVWDELLSGHAVSGSSGEALSAAGTAGDPWTTSLPGAYGAGTAGKIIGDNINAPLATIDTVVDGIQTDLSNATDGLGAIKADTAAILTDTGTTIPATIATAQADLDIITGASGVNLLTATQASIDAIELDTGTTLPATLTTIEGKVDLVDTNVDSVLVDTGTTIPGTLTSIKAKTDSLTFTTAGEVDANIQSVNDTVITGDGGSGTEWGPA